MLQRRRSVSYTLHHWRRRSAEVLWEMRNHAGQQRFRYQQTFSNDPKSSLLKHQFKQKRSKKTKFNESQTAEGEVTERKSEGKRRSSAREIPRSYGFTCGFRGQVLELDWAGESVLWGNIANRWVSKVSDLQQDFSLKNKVREITALIQGLRFRDDKLAQEHWGGLGIKQGCGYFCQQRTVQFDNGQLRGKGA